MEDKLPAQLLYTEVNVANHLLAIKYEALGPLDPREPNPEFWTLKAEKWQVLEGEARTRLCMNCAHYDNSPEIVEYMQNTWTPIKLQELPIDPAPVDIPGDLSACCTRWTITCTAMRTCDAWEAPWEDEDNANQLFCGPEEEEEMEMSLEQDVQRMLVEVKGVES